MNRTLLNRLAKASIDHPVDWDAHLDEVFLANRSSVHHTTSQIVFSRELRLPVDLMYLMSSGTRKITRLVAKLVVLEPARIIDGEGNFPSPGEDVTDVTARFR
ncbi:hypothetical protein T08_2858 [Trichinella sp. T8]|nr:hypothetical protein T08_2858 [Trichinella sp. T8]